MNKKNITNFTNSQTESKTTKDIKKESSKGKENDAIDKQKYNQITSVNKLPTQFNSITTDTMPCKANIENFPSRLELLKLLDDFLTKNYYDKNCYKIFNGSNLITLNFKDCNICFGFIKTLNMEKLTNSLYSKIKANIVFDFKVVHPKINRDNISKRRNKKEEEEKKKKKLKENKIFSRKKPLRICDPFKEQSKIEFEEHEENKAKWINRKGYFSAGNAEKVVKQNQIESYVLRTPGKYNFNNYKFRDIDKDKWICNKGFVVRKAPDDIEE